MMKKIVLSLTIATIMVALVIVNKYRIKQDETVTIGILQTISHPALDAVRHGIIEELGKTTGQKLTILYQNAEGSTSVAHSIAQGMHRKENIKAIITIGTLASQTAIKVEKTKPIIYAAVSNPDGLGVESAQTNVCGISDKVDIKMQVEVLAKIVPQAKTIAILYNPAESNSIYSVNEMKLYLEKLQLNPLLICVNSEAEMPIAAKMACQKTDALLLPTDNTVAATLKIVTTEARQYKKPIMCGVDLWVKDGALVAAGGLDYKKSGTIAGNYAKQIIVNGKKPGNITQYSATNNNIVVNKLLLDELKITIPQSLIKLIILE
jgi:putative ABC transport system substrate-binding protein